MSAGITARSTLATVGGDRVRALQHALYRAAKADRNGRTSTVKNVGEPCAGGSSRQGCDPAGESPAVSVVRVGHEATPLPGSGNRPGSAWCERPGGSAPLGAAVGATWRSSERRSPKVIE